MAQPRRTAAKRAARAPLTQEELVAKHMIVAEPMFGPMPPRVVSCRHCGGVVWNPTVHMQSSHPELLVADEPEETPRTCVGTPDEPCGLCSRCSSGQALPGGK